AATPLAPSIRNVPKRPTLAGGSAKHIYAHKHPVACTHHNRILQFRKELMKTITDVDSDNIAIDWEDWTLTAFARSPCISQTNDGDLRLLCPGLPSLPIPLSSGTSTECATPIPNLSSHSMWTHSNFLDKSDYQLYKRNSASYTSSANKLGLLTGCFEGGCVGRH
ncbi:hypothetical protein N7535_006832, partial [Penicillium sp. DV-2018c]